MVVPASRRRRWLQHAVYPLQRNRRPIIIWNPRFIRSERSVIDLDGVLTAYSGFVLANFRRGQYDEGSRFGSMRQNAGVSNQMRMRCRNQRGKFFYHLKWLPGQRVWF